jgi:hypothetical protein
MRKAAVVHSAEVQAPPGSMNGPPRNRGVENGDRGDEDQPLVGRRIGTVLPSEKNQWDESQNVERGNGKECPRIEPAGVTDQGVDGCKNRKYRHGAGKPEADQAKAAVHVRRAETSRVCVMRRRIQQVKTAPWM